MATKLSRWLFCLIKSGLSKRRISRLLKQRQQLSIDVGSGNKKGEGGWTTIDMARNCDIFWDLRKGIPFPDTSISKIYTSHFLEHLSYGEGQQFLDECLRVLIPAGTLSICVPNARIYIEAYLRNSDLAASSFFGYKPAYDNTTRIDYVNYTAYMAGLHRYMFDEENLVHILRAKGFKKVHLREFDPNTDCKERVLESIYALAEK